jgi:hypothetical protein
MNAPNFVPWAARFADICWYQMTDEVLAEHAANTNIGTADDSQFASDMVNLYRLRSTIFGSQPQTLQSIPAAFIEQQTRDMTGTDPDHVIDTWPEDHIGAALTVQKWDTK